MLRSCLGSVARSLSRAPRALSDPLKVLPIASLSSPSHTSLIGIRTLCTTSGQSGGGGAMSIEEALANLRSACEKELSEEQASEPIDVPIPEGWTYHHTPGSGYFTLCRSAPFPMEVFCRVEDPKPEAVGEGENNIPSGYSFVLRATRNQRTCELNCVAIEDELEIRSYRVFSETRSRDDFLNSESYFASQLSYEGPDLSHMDEGFMQTLFNCLESLGVNDALAAYIIKQAEVTEQREYERWLSELKQFTA